MQGIRDSKGALRRRFVVRALIVAGLTGTVSTDVVGPVSTNAGSVAWIRYADVTTARPVIMVSTPVIPGAASNVA